MKYTISNGARTLFLLTAFSVVGFYSNAQTVVATKVISTTPVKTAAFQSAAGVIDNFFKKYKISADSAVDYLFGTNKYFSNPAGIAQLKGKLDSLRQSLGGFIGHELIVEKTASPSLVLYSVLVKHEIQPVRFTFIFYRPHSDWVFYRFLFDDQMDQEMEDGAKIGNKHP
jgi:hypothetical protein